MDAVMDYHCPCRFFITLIQDIFLGASLPNKDKEDASDITMIFCKEFDNNFKKNLATVRKNERDNWPKEISDKERKEAPTSF
jgi:hypothetical protein